MIVIFIFLKMPETQEEIKTQIDKYAIFMFLLSTLLMMFAINDIQTSVILLTVY